MIKFSYSFISERALWAPAGARAVAYLHDKRALTDATISKYRLGYSPERQQIAGMDVPAGITIPWFAQSELWQVKVRTRSSEPGRKYLSVHWADAERAKQDGGCSWRRHD